MKIIGYILFCYILGSLNPAALISRFKNKNLRNLGTGNLGATNVMLNFGKYYGVIVMLFDVAKAFASVKAAQYLFPEKPLLPLISGLAAVVGHIFPFYMKFKGGKGLAPFGGLVLAYDFRLFCVLLAAGILATFISNRLIAFQISASLGFPIAVGLLSINIGEFIFAAMVGALIIFKHTENIIKTRKGTEIKVREYIKNNRTSCSDADYKIIWINTDKNPVEK